MKGLTGLPTEQDVLQVSKYVPRRRKEWDHEDVQGVVIINHQRLLPGLQRDHTRVFTEQQISDAKHHGIALVTTWQLFLLIRGMLRWGWSPDVIRALFYRPGRCADVPAHYRPLGRVGHFYDRQGVLSVLLPENIEVAVDDVLGYALPGGHLQEHVTSLQVDREQVPRAVPGQRVGIKTTFRRDQVGEGTTVYLVGPPEGQHP